MAVLVHPQSELIREPGLLVPMMKPKGPVRPAPGWPIKSIMLLTPALVDSVSGTKISLYKDATVSHEGIFVDTNYSCGRVPFLSVLNPNKGSLAFTFKKTGTPTAFQYFISSTLWTEFVFYNYTGISFRYNGTPTTNGNLGEAPSTINDGNWHTFAFSYKQSFVEYAYDGVWKASTTNIGSGVPTLTGDNLLIGNREETADRKCGGTIGAVITFFDMLPSSALASLSADPFSCLIPA